MIYTHVAAAILAGAVAFTAGWKVQGWRMDKQITALKASHDQAMAEAAIKARTLEQQLVSDKHNAEVKHEAIKKQSQRAIAGARSELDRLRDDLAARSGSTSQDPAACPGTDGAAPIERDLFGQCAGSLVIMAAEADRLATQVSGLQGYVGAVCK